MENEESQSTQVVEGAGNSQTQDAGLSSKGDGQGQETTQNPVGDSAVNASSEGNQQDRKGSWNQARYIEKVIQRQLRDTLSPIMEQLKTLQNPAVSQVPKSEPIDYSNLDQWLNNKIESQYSKLQGQLSEMTKTQEAKSYLSSQPDIGNDSQKRAEIREILESMPFDVSGDPVGAISAAVKVWRLEKGQTNVNPNRPTRAQLSTVTGGAGQQASKGLTIDQLKALQEKIINSNLPAEEWDKINETVNAIR